MAQGEVRLRAAWHAAMTASGAAWLPGAGDAVLDAVLGRYREPHRRYHTVAHVVAVVDHIEELAAVDAQLPPPELAVAVAAAVFHDAVYDPRSASNEAASAELAQRELAALGWPPASTSRCADLILATAHVTAGPPAGSDQALDVLLDADLAVLGCDPGAYAAYVRGVRAEYDFVDDASWRSGRAAVITGLLGAAHIFRTRAMRSAREHRARANLAAELAALGRDHAPGT